MFYWRILFTLILAQSFIMASSHSLNQRLEGELNYLKDCYGFPGITVAYVLPDGAIGEVACGFADREAKTSMTPHSRMLAASIGKTFVAATVLALSAEGLLHLDDPLERWIGHLDWYSRLANNKTVTLHQLLTHSAGIPDHVYTKTFLKSFSQKGMDEERFFSPESLIECILAHPPLCEAGHGWAYSDTGYILLGLVIEVATGNSWYAEIDRRFIKPLHLKMTSPSDQPTLSGLVAGYTSEDNVFGLPVKLLDKSGKMVYNPVIEWTGGGLISTSYDLAVWAKLLYEGQAIQSDYMKDLFRSVSIDDEKSQARFGAGVLIKQDEDLGQVWGHGGVIPGYVSSLRYYPKHKIAIAFQINMNSEQIRNAAEEIEKRLAKVLCLEEAFFRCKNERFMAKTDNCSNIFEFNFMGGQSLMMNSKWVSNGDVKIWTESFGNKKNPAVLLIIGAGAVSTSYSDYFCQRLVNAGFYVIRYDQRDYGNSTSFKQISPEILDDRKKIKKELPYRLENLIEDAKVILDDYEISKAHIVGHSMGGIIAQLFTAIYPNRVLSFTSIAVAPASERFPLEPIPEETMKKLLSNKPTGNFERDIDGWLGSYRLLNGKVPFDEDKARKYVQEIYRRCSSPGVAWNHIGIQYLLPDYYEIFQKNTVPGLILHGEEDPIQPVSYAKYVQSMIKNTKLIILPKLGHMFFNQEAEDLILDHLIEHFKSVSN